jgi:hypothetical protein
MPNNRKCGGDNLPRRISVGIYIIRYLILIFPAAFQALIPGTLSENTNQ